jgi:hypothetical protein
LSCWNEKGLLAVAAGFSGEPAGVSSELLSGADVSGELLRGALELKPRNEPPEAPVVAGVDFAGVDAGRLPGPPKERGLCAAEGLLASGCVVGVDVGAGDGLSRLAKEKAGASLACPEVDVGGVPKPPKPVCFAAGAA